MVCVVYALSQVEGKAESKRHSMIRGKMYLTVLVLCFVLKKVKNCFYCVCVGQDKQSYVVLILLSPFFIFFFFIF